MQRFPIKLIRIAIVAIVVLSAACSRSEIEFQDPWIPAAPPNVNVLAGYVDIQNNTSGEWVFARAHSDRFEKVEFHRTEQGESVLQMLREPSLVIPPHSTLSLAPGGYHLMLINPGEPVKVDQTIRVALTMNDGQQHDIVFTVRRLDFTL